MDIELKNTEGYRIKEIAPTMNIWVNTGEAELAERCAKLSHVHCRLIRSLEESIPIHSETNIVRE
jgi:hypothetical protein